MGSGNKYNLNDPDLQYFVTNTQFDREIHFIHIIYTFLNDMKNNLNYGDEKSSRYDMIKYLFQPQLGRLKQFIFLLSDPDELVDQLKLIVLEKVGGNDNPMLSEQIVAITHKLLEYECITNQHQNMQNTFGNV